MAGVCLSAILNAKNSTMTRTGMTPEQSVFGRSKRFTELSNTDDDQVLMNVLGNHGMAWKTSQIRTAAKVMLLRNDAMDKVRRAMLRQASTVIGEVMPGSRVYFWSPNPMRGRKRQDAKRWRGPATAGGKKNFVPYVALPTRFQTQHSANTDLAIALRTRLLSR